MSDLVGNPEDRFSHNKAQMTLHVICSDREIRYRCSMQNTILDVLRARPGWQEVPGLVNEMFSMPGCSIPCDKFKDTQYISKLKYLDE